MKPETKYSYQKRIQELESANSKLSSDLYYYKTVVKNIYEAMTTNIGNGAKTNEGWILRQIMSVFR